MTDLQKVNFMQRVALLLLTAVLATGCATTYSLISPDTVEVAKGNLSVRTSIAWNKAPRSAFDIDREESWTLNGPALDLVTFIGGVDDGKALAKQRRKEDRQLPVFKADMSPPELVSMLETYYRIKAGITVFETTSVMPVTFLDRPGMQIDYIYVGGDDVKRQGRTVVAVVDDRLYMMTLDGTALHYFGAALPEFESMVQLARII